ncbi:MAG TPA: SDR family oxidoreductase [Candidatus Thermoplasmatota archaeon]|nr:SDR family oxidoreductase [Candidatus Thermoplasmatota archaeon]
MLSKKRTLVTGGAGFIGSHIVDRLLADGHQVIVIDNYSTGRPENLQHHEKNQMLSVVEADIADFEIIEKYFRKVDWVFHIAALADIVPSIQRPSDYFQANVNGTFSVLEAARKSKVKRFVYAASSSSYGIPDHYPTSETADIRPQYPYALTKYMGEELVFHWGQVYKLPVVSMRFFNVYGPRARTSGTYGAVFGVFLAQKLNGKPFTVVGDGKQLRDFIYVTDVVNACVMAAESDITGESFNIGSGNPQSINLLVEYLGGEVVYIPKRPGEPPQTHADITKIQKLLKWKPSVSFEKGVKIMVDHIQDWKNAPLWTPQKINKATEDWFKYLSK